MSKFTLRNRIILYVVAATISILLLFTSVIYFDRKNDQIEQFKNLSILTAEKVSQEILGDFKKYSTITKLTISKSSPVKLARSQKDRDPESVKRNPNFKRTIDISFKSIPREFPEINDVYLGLEATGNYVSIRETVVEDPNYDCRLRPWYKEALDSGKVVFGSMAYAYTDSATSLSTVMPLFDMEDGKLLGVGGLDINISELRDKLKNIKVGERGKAFAIMPDRKMLYFPGIPFKLERVFADLEKDLPQAGGFVSLDSIMWKTSEGEESVFIDDEEFKVYWATIPTMNWRLGVIIPISELNEASNKILVNSLFFLILGIVLMTGVVYLISNPIIKPLHELAYRFKNLASAEGDLTLKLDEHGSGELGAVSSGFNSFIMKIRDMITSIKSGTSQISFTSETVVSSANKMKENARQMTDRTNEIAIAIKQMSQSISQIRDNTHTLELSTKSSLENIKGSGRNIAHFINSFEQLVNKIRMMSKSLRGLMQYSDSIDTTMSFIDDISDRVSLLALNASIEAASAGEYGQGFTVVAGEIKNLSAKIFDQTKESREKLDQLSSALQDIDIETIKLVDQTDKELEYSQKAGEAINTIESIVSESNSAIVEITTETAQQASSTGLISTTIDDFALQNVAFLKAIDGVSESIEIIDKMVHQLQTKVRKFKS